MDEEKCPEELKIICSVALLYPYCPGSPQEFESWQITFRPILISLSSPQPTGPQKLPLFPQSKCPWTVIAVTVSVTRKNFHFQLLSLIADNEDAVK